MPPAAPLDQRLAAQRGPRSAAWFADLAPTTGRDPASGPELEVDVTGWPTRVTRLDAVPAQLRDAAGLLSALRRATGAAALGHLLAVAATGDPEPDAAQLLDDHQRVLLGHWSSQLRNLVDLFADIVGETAELGDIGNWFTGGAGVVVQIIATAGSSAAAILDEAVQYWLDLNVGLAGDWSSVHAKLGDRGFVGEVWPDVLSIDLPNINQPWQPA
ncbi:hypothetical protein [Nocardioides sp.]|uniref:hypothetical protein n=1 Tax=Nocardioides sp. TaxID=35761 RepID=UPI00261BE191|nr:hypothetical protein [Nocardioides sp.]